MEIETKYGNVKLRVVMIDINGTDLCEGVEVKLDDELIGEGFNLQLDNIDELSVEEVEKIVERFL